LDAIQASKEEVMVDNGYLVVYTPIHFGNTDTPWSARVQIPYAVITAKAYQNTLLMVLAAVVLMILGLLAIWFLIGQIAIKPLAIMSTTAAQIAQTDLPSLGTVMGAMASGDLTQSITIQTPTIMYKSNNEMGNLARAFNTMISGLQDVGTNFTQMNANLRSMVGQVADNAANLSAASTQLASAAGQAAQVTGQITATIQQVAQGISQQTASVSKTASSTEQMGRAIDGVAKGAQDQSNAVTKAASLTSKLSDIIQHVAEQAKMTADGAGGAVTAAQQSVEMAKNTAQGMEAIKSKSACPRRKCRRWVNAQKRSAPLSIRLKILPIRPTCWHSTLPSRRPAPVNTAKVLLL
jgi:methyl-accepting chemotaxis protein